MCWISNDAVKEILKEDEVTYKILRPISDTEARATVFSEHIYHKGTSNPYVKINPEFSTMYRAWMVDEGYHSYTKIPDMNNIDAYHAIYRMIIPKGTVVYRSNMRNEIVSSNIIMQELIAYNGKFVNIRFTELLKYIWNNGLHFLWRTK